MCWYLSGEWGDHSTAQRQGTEPNYRTRSERGQPERKFQEAEGTQRNGKDPKDQLSVECKYCGNKHERKRDKFPAYAKGNTEEKPTLKPTILQQSAPRIHANLRRSVLRNLNVRKWTSSMTTQSLLILQKKRSCQSCLAVVPHPERKAQRGASPLRKS